MTEQPINDGTRTITLGMGVNFLLLRTAYTDHAPHTYHAKSIG